MPNLKLKPNYFRLLLIQISQNALWFRNQRKMKIFPGFLNFKMFSQLLVKNVRQTYIKFIFSSFVCIQILKRYQLLVWIIGTRYHLLIGKFQNHFLTVFIVFRFLNYTCCCLQNWYMMLLADIVNPSYGSFEFENTISQLSEYCTGVSHWSGKSLQDIIN